MPHSWTPDSGKAPMVQASEIGSAARPRLEVCPWSRHGFPNPTKAAGNKAPLEGVGSFIDPRTPLRGVQRPSARRADGARCVRSGRSCSQGQARHHRCGRIVRTVSGGAEGPKLGSLRVPLIPAFRSVGFDCASTRGRGAVVLRRSTSRAILYTRMRCLSTTSLTRRIDVGLGALVATHLEHSRVFAS
jgi:hypothetical protein